MINVKRLPEDALHSYVLGQLPDFTPDPETTAMVVVDMQRLDADRGIGIGPGLLSRDPDGAEYYFRVLEDTVQPNIRKLLKACRTRSIPVMHTRNASILSSGRDQPWRRRYIAPRVLLDSPEAEFLEGVQPQGDELVFNKTTASAFNSTNIAITLAHMRVDTLIVAGVVTNMCVESFVRDAGDLGFRVLLVEDGCAALTQEEQDHALRFLHRRFANVVRHEFLIQELER